MSFKILILDNGWNFNRGLVFGREADVLSLLVTLNCFLVANNTNMSQTYE